MIKLFNSQLDAVKKLHNGCVLCGGTGSGKSLTALGWYYIQNGGTFDGISGKNHVPMRRPKDLYIITTAAKRDKKEWEKEMIPFLLSTDPEQNYYRNRVVVDSWNNISKYIAITGAIFLFDEQRVVGKGKWVSSFLKIAKNNQWILLSATPGDNWDNYAALFVANGFFRNRSQFEREHEIYSRFSKFPQISGYRDEGRLLYLKSLILVDIDCDRPTIQHHEDVYVGYDVTEYRDLIRTRWDPWKDQPIDNASGMCYAMRKIVNSDESRTVALLEIVEKHPRCIIFYNFDYELEILRSLVYPEGTETAEWNGHKHEPVPNGTRWVYFVNYAAGAEGWNCITTDTMIFWSQSYSYKVMVQASGRIDRINTPYTDLYYYHLKSRSGIDIAIGRALADKRTFNEKNFVKW